MAERYSVYGIKETYRHAYLPTAYAEKRTVRDMSTHHTYSGVLEGQKDKNLLGKRCAGGKDTTIVYFRSTSYVPNSYDSPMIFSWEVVSILQ